MYRAKMEVLILFVIWTNESELSRDCLTDVPFICKYLFCFSILYQFTARRSYKYINPLDVSYVNWWKLSWWKCLLLSYVLC
jgi:hypothetical protein